jgi:hypothetical protein
LSNILPKYDIKTGFFLPETNNIACYKLYSGLSKNRITNGFLPAEQKRACEISQALPHIYIQELAD